MERGKWILSVLTLCALTEGMETDYCNMDATRCDKDGKYKHMWATGYEDFIVRDVMDKTLETIQTEPEVALRRAEETLQAFPNSSRAILNFINAQRFLMSTEEDSLKKASYSTNCIQLCSRMLDLPETTVAPEVYKVVCNLYVHMAKQSSNLDTVAKASMTCVDKSHYLDIYTLHYFRTVQITNMFLQKQFKEALEAFQKLSADIEEWKTEMAAVNKKAPQIHPYLAVIKEATIRIVGKNALGENDESAKHNIKNLTDDKKKILTEEKMKYENFIQTCKEHGLDEDILSTLQQAGDEPGLFESYISKYEQPRPFLTLN